ncbi:MAG TPA: hypothetical protein VM364_12860 [Vicinamibacterales bacterium]|nr:hypothetical protein [Vicinamibacterales bacterium]
MRRVDTRRVVPFVRYTWFPERPWLVSVRPELRGEMLWDHSGTLHDWQVSSELQFELKGQTEIELGYDESMERFRGAEFRKRDLTLRFESAWLKWLELEGGADVGPEINFFPPSGLLPFVVDGVEADAALVFKPLPQLRVDQRYLFTRLRTRDALAATAAGSVVVSNHIWRSRAAYQFTRRLSLRAIVDYSAVTADARLIDLEDEKRFSTDLLATYMLNPWTAVYVGYTDGYGNLELDRTAGVLRVTDSPFHSLGRQVFVKLSYLLRF